LALQQPVSRFVLVGLIVRRSVLWRFLDRCRGGCRARSSASAAMNAAARRSSRPGPSGKTACASSVAASFRRNVSVSGVGGPPSRASSSRAASTSAYAADSTRRASAGSSPGSSGR
jgi:hypothetical protein